MSRHAQPKKRRLWWKIPVAIVGFFLVVVIAYVAYVFLSYNRIEDNRSLEVHHAATADEASPEKTYTAVCYNVGFGAYTPDFTFFMDGGTSSWANSKESVESCTGGASGIVRTNNADFVLFQEVDDDSTRSYHVNQYERFCADFASFDAVFARNAHSAFLFYPFTQPHGFENSGLVTLSDVTITSSLRRSLPINEGFSKIVDLDRCYSISRVNVENGKELVLFNVHLSAYGTDGDLQDAQLDMLFGDMKAEYEKGNYVLCGGDYNHDFTCGSKDAFNTDYEERAWAADFPDEKLPKGFSKAIDFESGMVTPSCRDCDIPYSDKSFTVIVDGFIFSDNIEETGVDIIDTGFAYSDHNPVKFTFKLK